MVFMTAAAIAQRGQTGTLKGTIVDQQTAVLPGVSVTIKSPSLVISKMSTVSNEQGIYRFPSLAPGTYEVIFEMSGMSALVRKEIGVHAGQTTELNVALTAQTLNTQVVVTGEAPLIDKQSTTKLVTLGKELLSELPSARTLDGFFNMTPGVVAENYSLGPTSSAHGSGVRDNAFNLDGVNISDPVYGIQMAEFGVEIMEEISVQSGGVSAEFGDSSGTFVNVITKSGGNSFSGSGFFYYTGNALQSTNTKGTDLEGSQSGYKYYMEGGITFGGPLVKDRLWFFANASLQNSKRYVSGYPYDQDADIPFDEARVYPYLKLSFQPDQGNKIALSYNFSKLKENHKDATAFETEQSTARYSCGTHVLNAQWTRMFKRGSVHEPQNGIHEDIGRL